MTVALVAGSGRLPAILQARLGPEALLCSVEGVAAGLDRAPDMVFRLETMGSAMAEMGARGATRVCLAGAMRRPAIDRSAIDEVSRPILERLLPELGKGDDAALRAVLSAFEAAGLTPIAAHEIAPDLLPPAGCPTRATPGPDIEADRVRAAGIVRALGASDLGQSCVVAGGQVLAVEAAPGTDWMLDTLAGEVPGRPDGARGLLWKAPKPGQDLRADMPAIGPETVTRASAAGLAGIAVQSGGVLVLDLPEVIARADAAGLFFWVAP
ncbi:LpxI family protein [Tropicimonas sp. IMCC34011]|uniref:LpxI family protein n=1 Tax=Tropicimonas sp. IMCC34011 TaxID=2248759 RepID=UPI000E243F98|nr:UDP-2,3-diacylglucosamine diphosphatase LpxI [Tropicimonas sp. IMCC34011]